ncbi:MAG: phosphatidylserine/phosphatidylglycerophosphate/cardiolipin synthase family protein [Lachnospiraceae bacterium]|nr:phosphatidylserine/phosphatidylglycerophosphate/cardiolipin synthase family protein [Lachnospiraceae bacterium]
MGRKKTEIKRTLLKTASVVMAAVMFLCACSSDSGNVGEVPEQTLATDVDDADETVRPASNVWIDSGREPAGSATIDELINANEEIILNSRSHFTAGISCDDEPMLELSSFLSQVNASPVYDDTRFEYFADGEEAFQSMLESLRSAEDYIFMEYFIINSGSVWDDFHEILKKKASEGVEVRILVDGWAVQWFLPHDFLDTMEAEGIRTYVTAPLTRGSDILSLMRDHRKILVVDGKCAYTGGVNLSDEYANRITKFGHWKDNAIRLEGECVKSFVLMFLQMWELFGEETDYDRYLSCCERLDPGNDLCIPYCDTPLDDQLSGREVYMNMLRNSEKQVFITVPYFTPDDEFLDLMISTAERGVHITLILPGIPDRAVVLLAARSYYRRLVAAGIDVYEYSPGFIHQKVCVCDGCRCSVGSVNLDNRSLNGQYECGVYMYSEDLAECILSDIEDVISVSTQMTDEVMDEMGINSVR